MYILFSFFCDPRKDMSSSGFPAKKIRPLIGRPDRRLANQESCFFLDSCVDSDLR